MSECAPCIAVPVWTGTGNWFPLAVESDAGGLMQSLAGLTRVTLQVGDTLIDSAVDGSAIWWTDTLPYRGATVPVIKFRLGGLGLAVGTYEDCALLIYDPISYPLGLRPANSIKITVHP